MKRGVALRTLHLYMLATACIASAFAVAALIEASGHELVVNTSPSMPFGLYWMACGIATIRRGSVVLFVPPDNVRALIYGRGWLPDGMPLLKTVGGLAGDEYCVHDGRFVVADNDIGPVFLRDSQGRPIPQIDGCRRVGETEFLPVALILDRSFDGRYMGAVPMRNVLGVGYPLITF
jgi:conjugative transfer signal peptidase TraF